MSSRDDVAKALRDAADEQARQVRLLLHPTSYERGFSEGYGRALRFVADQLDRLAGEEEEPEPTYDACKGDCAGTRCSYHGDRRGERR